MSNLALTCVDCGSQFICVDPLETRCLPCDLEPQMSKIRENHARARARSIRAEVEAMDWPDEITLQPPCDDGLCMLAECPRCDMAFDGLERTEEIHE